jgi:hypothetical protein
LPLALGDDPVLNTDKLARAGIRPTNDIARGEDSGRTRFQILIDHYAAIYSQACLLGYP